MPNPISGGLLKQPDKHKITKPIIFMALGSTKFNCECNTWPLASVRQQESNLDACCIVYRIRSGDIDEGLGVLLRNHEQRARSA